MEPQEQQENNEDNLSPSVSSPSHSNSPKKKKKRTRDLPNLTQCHSCGFRIDSCSGNDTLQTLYSEWRIVLLCQNCFVAVESSNLCSYCFKTGSSHDSFSCRQCKHIIHKTCFSTSADVAPWSFCCSTTHFSICLDCWVPKLVAQKRAYCTSKRKNPVVFDLGNCRKRLLENVVRDADFDAPRKIEAATRARELAVAKALGARRAARLAEKALGIMIGDRDDNAVSEVDDVELAMRAMNCSLKILKDFSSVNSNSNPLVTDDSCRIPEVSPGVSVPETSVCVRVSDYDSSMILDSLGSNGNDDAFLGKNDKDCGMKVPLKDGDGGRFVSHSGRARNFIKYTRRTFANVLGNGKPDRYKIKYIRRASVHKTDNAKTNRYLVKYARRTSTNQRYKGKPDRFAIKYTRRKLNQRPILDRKSNCLDEASPRRAV